MDKSPLYIPIIGRYKDQRGNLIILGKIESGILRQGDVMVLMPGNVKITPLFFGNDAGKLSIARPGENVSIAVKGVKEEYIQKGFILCDPNQKLDPISEFVGQVSIIDLPSHSPVISKGFKAMLHIHTASEECAIANLLAEIDRKTKQKKKPRYIKNRAIVDIHISLAQPVCMTTFEFINQLGRFTIRDSGKTLGFGKVLKLGPPTKKANC